MSNPLDDSLEIALVRQQMLVEQQPRSAEARISLAKLLLDCGRADQAVAAMEAAIALRPGNLAGCYNNLGVIHDHQKNWQAAAAAYRQAIALQPTYAIAHKNMGDALRQLGQLESALASYETAVGCAPAFGEARAALGLALYLGGQFRKAIEQLHLAIQLNPRDGNSHTNLALCHARLAEHDSALAAARRAVEIDPSDPELHSNLIAMLNYTQGGTPVIMLNESREWHRRHVVPLAQFHRRHANSRRPDRPLRIGYISPDFREHPVSVFIEPVLAHHDRSHFTIACYAQVAAPDVVTGRIESTTDLWRNIVGRSHDEVAQQVRADGIDILVDLCGHLLDNRLPVLARKPAPVQSLWLGYLNTSGTSRIDYRLTDGWADPVDSADLFYSEKLFRLPHAFFVYQPPVEAPPVGPSPMLTAGHVSFASFNNFTKITPMTVEMWAGILQAVPNARLLMSRVPPDAVDGLLNSFRSFGVDIARIEIKKKMSVPEYFESHNRVDISLDPFPWTGHTTTCHSLWMGVPVVSLAGPTAISRAGMSVMGPLDLNKGWVAATPREYVRLAVEWAGKPRELAELRASLRDRMHRSPLTDAAGFTRHLESAYRQMWTGWCGQRHR